MCALRRASRGSECDALAASRARSSAACAVCDFAEVGVARHLSNPLVVHGSRLVFHLREGAGRVLAKNRVKRNQRLQNGAPLALIQSPHAVKRHRERRIFNGRKLSGGEGLVRTIEDELKLCQFQRLGQKLNLPQQKRVATLELVDVDRQRFAGPDPGSGEISFR